MLFAMLRAVLLCVHHLNSCVERTSVCFVHYWDLFVGQFSMLQLVCFLGPAGNVLGSKGLF